jgi:hypothetical protein
MYLIHAIVISVVIAAPMAAIYFRRSSAAASIAAFILALSTCDNAACSAALFSLIFVILVVWVDLAEASKATSKDQQATLGDDGRFFAEIADERESE